jgi:hypothetical protein
MCKLKEGHDDDDDDDDAGKEEGDDGLDWSKFRYMMSFHALYACKERPLPSIVSFGRVGVVCWWCNCRCRSFHRTCIQYVNAGKRGCGCEALVVNPHMISRESCIAHSRWVGKVVLLNELIARREVIAGNID